MPDASMDAVVTDPPYALGTLHDAGWDTQVAFDERTWREVLRVLKPGGWVLSFGGPRTYHRMVTALENAGAEVHDALIWVYSSGFPRGKSPAAAIAAAGGDPEDWRGYGTTLKPAAETIVLARKPREGTVAANVVKHGTGLLDIDGNRIGDEVRYNPPARNKAGSGGPFMAGKYGMPEGVEGTTVAGRHPANFILDAETAEELPELARYFYVAKPTREERAQAGGHPTVKPLALMRHLVRIVTPPGGRVLDPFTGSGTTGVACMEEGFSFRGIELDFEYAVAALARLKTAGAVPCWDVQCWDCNDTGEWCVDPGNSFDTPPHVEPCWCPVGEKLIQAYEASREPI